MKIKSILMLAVVACALSSCFNNTGSQSTPILRVYNGFVNPQFVGDSLVGAEDTLRYHINNELGMQYSDTVHLGDTIMLPSWYHSNMNNLVSIRATVDTVRVDLWFDIDMSDKSSQSALMADSKPEKGIIFFKPMHNMANFPIYVVPQEMGAHIIKITVTSDSQFPESNAIFTMPVAAAKED